MGFNNAKEIYDYIMSQPVPESLTIPTGIQNAYQGALQAGKYYAPQIHSAMKQYGTYPQTPNSGSYQSLVDMYNKQYKQNAAIAAAEAVKASESMNAGYGDTYSKAATKQAYTGYMADRGAAYPALLTAAAKAVAANKDAQAAGINAMTAQRSANMQTAQQAYSDRYSDWNKDLQAKQQAYNTLLNSLSDLYSYQYAQEHPTSSGGSGGSGRRSSGGKRYKITGDDDDNTGIDPQPEKTAEEVAYEQAIANYPLLKDMMKPDEFFENGGQNAKYNYFQYIDNEIQKYYKKNGKPKAKPSEFRGSGGGHYTK